VDGPEWQPRWLHGRRSANALAGTYTFTLTVTDPGKLSSQATTHVTVNPPPNHPPVANAGPDQTVPFHSPATVQLNASASTDPDGDTLTYVWKDQSGSTVGNAPILTLALMPGTYTFTLTVTDPGGLSSQATTHVTVNAPVNHPPVANAVPAKQLAAQARTAPQSV